MPRMKAGKLNDANHWITQHLLTGDKTLGEIKIFLKEKKIGYADNKGLLLRLEDLMNTGTINKHKLKKNSYPTYYLSKQELKKISFKGRVFANHVSKKLLSNLIASKNSGTKEEEFVEMMIRRCGFYVMYTVLQGWKLALSSKQNSKKMTNLEEWLGNTLPMPSVATVFHTQLSKMIDPKNELLLNKSVVSYPDLRKTQLEIIEITLNQLFPDEMKICDTEMKNLKKTTQRVLKDIIEIKKDSTNKIRKKV